MGQAMVNIAERMKYRNFKSLDRPWKSRWRPRPMTVGLARDLKGLCIIPHKKFWRHEVVHVPHPRNLRCSQNRCFYVWHRFPGEIALRVMIAAWRGRLRHR